MVGGGLVNRVIMVVVFYAVKQIIFGNIYVHIFISKILETATVPKESIVEL